MKTIEERAKEYEKKYYDGAASECRLAFIRGAQSERAELTRWHDPKEELPNDEKAVLLKINYLGFVEFKVGQWDRKSHRWWGDGIDEYSPIIGWREIHE